jgi:hypothetical protein
VNVGGEEAESAKTIGILEVEYGKEARSIPCGCVRRGSFFS